MIRLITLLTILFSISTNLYSSIKITYSGEELPDKVASKIDLMISTMYDFYSKVGVLEESEVELIVFKNIKDGYRYMRTIYPDNPNYKHFHGEKPIVSYVGGVYVGHLSKAVILGMENGIENALKTIYHELSHHFTQEVFKYKKFQPVWLNEGLAEYFEGMQVKGKNIKGSQVPLHQKGQIKTMIMLDEFDVYKILSLPQIEFKQRLQKDGGLYYSISHVLVAVIIEQIGLDGFAKMVNAIANRNLSDNIADIVSQNYKGGLKDLENDIIKFVQ